MNLLLVLLACVFAVQVEGQSSFIYPPSPPLTSRQQSLQTAENLLRRHQQSKLLPSVILDYLNKLIYGNAAGTSNPSLPNGQNGFPFFPLSQQQSGQQDELPRALKSAENVVGDLFGRIKFFPNAYAKRSPILQAAHRIVDLQKQYSDLKGEPRLPIFVKLVNEAVNLEDLRQRASTPKDLQRLIWILYDKVLSLLKDAAQLNHAYGKVNLKAAIPAKYILAYRQLQDLQKAYKRRGGIALTREGLVDNYEQKEVDNLVKLINRVDASVLRPFVKIFEKEVKTLKGSLSADAKTVNTIYDYYRTIRQQEGLFYGGKLKTEKKLGEAAQAIYGPVDALNKYSKEKRYKRLTSRLPYFKKAIKAGNLLVKAIDDKLYILIGASKWPRPGNVVDDPNNGGSSGDPAVAPQTTQGEDSKQRIQSMPAVKESLAYRNYRQKCEKENVVNEKEAHESMLQALKAMTEKLTKTFDAFDKSIHVLSEKLKDQLRGLENFVKCFPSDVKDKVIDDAHNVYLKYSAVATF